MNITKQQIMKSALNYFSQKGYFATSMQDIAIDCGIGKGSIYKFFPSKEDLFIEIFDASQKNMFQLAQQISSDETISPKTKLINSIAFQFQYYMDNPFITMDFKELPVRESEKFVPIWQKTKAKISSWHRDCLMQAYGKEIDTYIWDVLAIFQGIVKEYLFYVIHEARPLPLEQVATFIVRRMDLIVDDLLTSKPTPLLGSVIIQKTSQQSHFKTREQSLRDIFKTIEVKIGELQITEANRQDFLEVLVLLQDQVFLAEPNRILIKALLSYLESNSELQSHAKQIAFILNRTI